MATASNALRSVVTCTEISPAVGPHHCCTIHQFNCFCDLCNSISNASPHHQVLHDPNVWEHASRQSKRRSTPTQALQILKLPCSMYALPSDVQYSTVRSLLLRIKSYLEPRFVSTMFSRFWRYCTVQKYKGFESNIHGGAVGEAKCKKPQALHCRHWPPATSLSSDLP